MNDFHVHAYHHLHPDVVVEVAPYVGQVHIERDVAEVALVDVVQGYIRLAMSGKVIQTQLHIPPIRDSPCKI